jgi:hypothetical protein
MRTGGACRNVGVVVAALLLLQAVVSSGAVARPVDGDDAGGPTKPIQPGGPVCGVDEVTDAVSVVAVPCRPLTLNFVFVDGDGLLYIGSAAHGFAAEGDRVRLPGETRPFGTVVFDSDSADFGHPGSPPDDDLLDFALIKIDRNRYRDVEPRVRGVGGPTGVADAEETVPGAPLVAYGNGGEGAPSPVPLVEPKAGARAGNLVDDGPTAFLSTVEETGGDSGMPYLYKETGEALGVNANCACGTTGSYPTVRYVLERLADARFHVRLVLGAPGPALTS